MSIGTRLDECEEILRAQLEALNAMQTAIETIAEAVKDLHARVKALEAAANEPLIVVPSYSGKVS